MNKPERPEIFDKAGGLIKRAADAGGNAVRGARDAGQRAWDKVTEGEDEQAKRRRVLFMLGGGIVAAIVIMSVLSRLGGDGAIEAAPPTAMGVSAITAEMQPLQATISLSGEARPIRDIQVAAPATGVSPFLTRIQTRLFALSCQYLFPLPLLTSAKELARVMGCQNSPRNLLFQVASPAFHALQLSQLVTSVPLDQVVRYTVGTVLPAYGTLTRKPSSALNRFVTWKVRGKMSRAIENSNGWFDVFVFHD